MKKITNQEFIKRAQAVHGNKYDYSLTEYKKSSKKIKIICPNHGAFTQAASDHIRGRGCRECAGVERWTTKRFIKKAKELFGNKYCYDLAECNGINDKIKIICKKHGRFSQSAKSHLKGSGCKECSKEKISEFQKERFQNIKYNTKKRTCKYCDKEMDLNYDNFPVCGKYSSGETRFLHKCRDCKNKHKRNYWKTYYPKNRKKINQQTLKSNKRHREKINKKTRQRRKIDPKFRLDENHSRNIRKALKGNKKGRSWENLVGYTIDDLKAHLESLFEPWMTWDNWGRYNPDGPKTWQIDHVIPKSWFNYTCPEEPEFKECWALSNLQPKESLENITKRNNFAG